ncbi:uncharacterized protein LOC130635421 [Hydractinia symbiolongicarpus]|uniref:uncharacterized protein LOC130635421 n=1 Tax=Hydractinia symbiolongicarpus TaxID=13093 RepID=UPI002551707C|nr:uncharacterized protein LOC130635421 [Hydractinia symbiolongicarpus]
MTIEIILPLLPAFTLRSEITTDNEDYVFMSIDNVTVSFIGSGIKLNGSQVVKNSSIQGYGNIDIVKGATIDFGNVQISNESTISQRTILVSCVIKVNPHPMLMEGSSHYIGFGVQAGPIFLVAKNKSVIIQANAERDLYLMMEKPANRSSWLFSGDNVNITYKIGYTTNSIVADNLLAIFSTKYFLLTNVYQSGVIPPFGSINATAYKVDLGTTLKQGTPTKRYIKYFKSSSVLNI